LRLPGTIGWFFHRITGAVLFFGLILHFYVMHFAGAQNFTYEAVMARFASPWWIGFNAAFLVSAAYHGFNGLWGIGLEYIKDGPALRWLRFGLNAAGVALVLVGFYILTLG